VLCCAELYHEINLSGIFFLTNLSLSLEILSNMAGSFRYVSLAAGHAG